ncbi:hypothetical protein BASA62_002143 [Batrachochytrium salamandrivorans]|nr:hypothetical protein BASA62_002143 [Batrachochytrium salamandrivorans]
MFDPLLWVLPHFVTHYAGQTTQGNTNGDGVDQASGSKDVTSLPLEADDLNLPRIPWRTKASSKNGASVSADSKPDKGCKGLRWIRKLFRSCTQQQSSTSYDPVQPNEMPLPASVEWEKARSYVAAQNTKEYREFITKETQRFESEYLEKKELGKGSSGAVYMATRKSDGMKVVYKPILNTNIPDYTLEPIPPPVCYIRNHLSRSKKPLVKQCISSRPPNILLPHELGIQLYLSRPGHENPYVAEISDYIILKDKVILVMEYVDNKWISIISYVKKKGPSDIEKARKIIREVVNGMVFLKRHGILHMDIHGKVKFIDFGKVEIFPGWEKGKSVPLKSSDPLPTGPEYKIGYNEVNSIKKLGVMLYTLLTGRKLSDNEYNYQEKIRTIVRSSNSSKSKLKEKAINFIADIIKLGAENLLSIEHVLKHPFLQLKNK